jgi:hypothetical protein
MANKRNIRTAKRTLLWLGEGKAEKTFLQHLKRCFLSRDGNVAVKVENAFGGSPQSIIECAKKHIRTTGYDCVLVLLDTDREWPKNIKSKYKKSSLLLVGSKPCLEGLYLKILNHTGFSPEAHNTDECKDEFYKHFMNENEIFEIISYEKYFPCDKLKSHEIWSEELNVIIKSLNF